MSLVELYHGKRVIIYRKDRLKYFGEIISDDGVVVTIRNDKGKPESVGKKAIMSIKVEEKKPQPVEGQIEGA